MSEQVGPSPLVEALAYSPRDAARVSGLGVTTIYKLINEGQLDRRKVGSRSLVTATSLRRLIEGEAS
ncbi:MAG: helix-turn-helix domain-containing protein [Erythrobacter sp.]